MQVSPLEANQMQVDTLVRIVHQFHSKGWSPATSTNYSFRCQPPDNQIFGISVSGVDKSLFSPKDLMLIDAQGNPMPAYQHLKPSAETLIHTFLYQNPETKAVLHTHSVYATVLSKIFEKKTGIILKNWEVLKGIKGVNTHQTTVFLPIFANTQDMRALSQELTIHYQNNESVYGFLLAGHGLYAWGSSLAEAKRHIETFEFLLECFYQQYLLKKHKQKL